MAKNTKPTTPDAPMPTVGAPIPTSGGSYVVENGELRKVEPDTTPPAAPPAAAAQEE